MSLFLSGLMISMISTDIDILWRIREVEAILENGSLNVYRYIATPHLPHYIYYFIPPVSIAKLLHTSPLLFISLWTLLFASLSIILIHRLLTIIKFPNKELLFWVSLLLMVSPAMILNQKLHICLIFLLPYLFFRILGNNATSISHQMKFLLAAMAIFGIAIKPQYIIILVILEVILILYRKSFRDIWLSALIALCVTAYYILVLLVLPDFKNLFYMFFLTYKYYLPTQSLGLQLLRGLFIIPLSLTFVIFIKVIKNNLLVLALAIMAFGSFFIAYSDGKAFPHHHYASNFFAILSILLMTHTYLKNTVTLNNDIRKGILLFVTLMTVGLYTFINIFGAITYDTNRKQDNEYSSTVNQLRPVISGQNVYHLSLSGNPLIQVIADAEGTLVSRFFSVWMLPGFEQLNNNHQASIQTYIWEEVAYDIEHNRPDIIIFDDRSFTYHENKYTINDFLRLNQNVASQLNNYMNVYEKDGFITVYKKPIS